MQPKYAVKIISHNLRQEETIIQIAEALNYLSDVSEDIFNRINARIETNEKNVRNLKQRIEIASNKLDILSGAKNATQVYSSSKYPGSKTNQLYKSVFSDCEEPLPMKSFQHTYKSSPIRDEPLETLQFYHVEVKQSSERETFKGLGQVPEDVETVNELLLFNSGLNPYKNFSHTTNTKERNHTRSVKDKEKELSGLDIGAAPLSISENRQLHRNNTEMYFYSPNLGVVPNLNVPIDLPDLPGIADNVRYNIEDYGPGIAPSVSSLNLPEDLPEIVQEIPPVKEEILPSIEHVSSSKPQKNIEKTVNNEEKHKTIDKKTASGPPPPPPPPPIQQIENKPQKVASEIPPPPDEIPDRANLMEAIRRAGGARHLKRADPTDQEPSNPSSGGDLMADLHAKLSMRRKGISGNKENPSAMDKVSAMIPPPPAQAEVSESTEDDDWDD